MLLYILFINENINLSSQTPKYTNLHAYISKVFFLIYIILLYTAENAFINGKDMTYDNTYHLVSHEATDTLND